MITKEQALKLKFGDWLHQDSCRLQLSPTGKKITVKSVRWKVNGKIKLWKTKPEAFEIPLKHGLKAYSYMNDLNANRFHLEIECPVNKEASRLATLKTVTKDNGAEANS